MPEPLLPPPLPQVGSGSAFPEGDPHDRRMTGKLCYYVGLITLLAGLAGPLLEIVLVYAVLSPRGHEPWTRPVMLQVVAGALLQILLSALMWAVFTALSRSIPLGGIATVWEAVIVAGAWYLLDCIVLIFAATAYLYSGNAAMWQAFAVLLLMFFHVQIMYHGLRTILLAKLRTKPAEQGVVPAEVGLRAAPEMVRSRPAVVQAAAVLLVVNLGYGVFAWSQHREFQRQLPAPSSAEFVGTLPGIPEPLPVHSASEPYAGDVFDPKYGMNRQERESVLAAVRKLKVGNADEAELDRVLRESGRKIVGEIPPDGEAIAVSGDASGVLQFAHGKLTARKGRGGVQAERYMGLFTDEVWEEWREQGKRNRWGCAAIEREVESVARLLPTPAPLRLGAVRDILRTNMHAGYRRLLNRVSAASGPEGAMYLTVFDQRYRISPDGRAWDASPAGRARAEQEREAARTVLARARDARARAKASYEEAMAAVQRRAAAVERWGFAPVLLLADALIGVALAGRMFWAGLWYSKRASSGMVRAVVVWFVLGTVAWGVMVSAWRGMDMPPPKMSMVAVAFLIVWRVGQSAILVGLRWRRGMVGEAATSAERSPLARG